MAYVTVPKDLTKVRNKVILNLTKRQLICLAAAVSAGMPFYFFARGHIGTGNAAAGMVLTMLPAFLFAMYEKDGMPLERILWNIINVKWLRPSVRRYEVENLYGPRETDEETGEEENGKTKRRQGSQPGNGGAEAPAPCPGSGGHRL